MILFVSETYLNSSLDLSNLSVPGYVILLELITQIAEEKGWGLLIL